MKKNARTEKDEEEGLPVNTSILILTEVKCRQKECERLVTSNKDLAALLQGSVKCKKGSLPVQRKPRKILLIPT